jgi:hypothetical protein
MATGAMRMSAPLPAVKRLAEPRDGLAMFSRHLRALLIVAPISKQLPVHE